MRKPTSLYDSLRDILIPKPAKKRGDYPKKMMARKKLGQKSKK